MKLERKINKLLVFILMILISITLSFSILGFIYNLFPKLNDFKILNIKEEKSGLFLYTTKCYNAMSYNVIAYDKNDNIILKKSSKTNKINISELILEYDENVNFRVIVKNSKNETKNSSNIYKYKNKLASFYTLKDHFVDKNEDVNLFLLGYSNSDNYLVKLYYKNTKILETKVSSNNISFKYSDISKYNGKITAKLYNKNNRAISIFNFYLNAPLVGDVKITSPTNDFVTKWDDINLHYTGGANATDLTIKVYDQKNKLTNLIKKSFNEGNIILPANYFKENSEYKIEVIASYLDYMEISKSDIINIKIEEKETVKPVYVNKNFTFIKSGTEILLNTDTKDATIYYTINGKNPDENSLVYNKPITIYSDMIIKTYAVKNNMYNSDVNTYEFKVKSKDLVVYLSPSNQYLNKGVSQTGYTNERDMMNKLTDYIEKRLKSYGVKVYRNKSAGNIDLWLSESRNKKSDFHFAIHSNASETNDARGIEIYIDKSTSKSLSLASNIYNNLYKIYPYKDQLTNRGVKYANSSLGEVNDSFINCGALLEVAYHDNYYDALWIVQNMEDIANNIANSILEFYQLKE